MYVAFVLRRKRDGIAATIAVYEARIDAARMDLAVLEQAARLFDPEAERGGDTSLSPLARAKRANDQDASLSDSMEFAERQFTERPTHSAVRAPREAPEEFFTPNGYNPLKCPDSKK
jgi:hypothetical protein